MVKNHNLNTTFNRLFSHISIKLLSCTMERLLCDSCKRDVVSTILAARHKPNRAGNSFVNYFALSNGTRWPSNPPEWRADLRCFAAKVPLTESFSVLWLLGWIEPNSWPFFFPTVVSANPSRWCGCGVGQHVGKVRKKSNPS